MTALGDEGFENAVFDHPLDGPHRQAEHFGGLAGAEIGLVDLGVFQGEFLNGVAKMRFDVFGLFECYGPASGSGLA